jgi:hypothetical protein
VTMFSSYDGQTRATSGWQPTAHGTTDPQQLTLDSLARRCAAENECFRHSQPSDPRYAYELFRRALVERNDDAWAVLYELYRSLVEHWVRKNTAFAASGEPSEVLVGEAFARFWQALPPERFTQFPSAAALLHYLQLCTGCVVIDSARAVARLAPIELAPVEDTHQPALDEEVIGQMRRQELWHLVGLRLNGEAERVVIVDSFVYGLKPATIHARRPDLFASVNEVYLVKRNVIERLGRDPGLRALLG